MTGLSWKRTDLEGLLELPVRFRKDEEAGSCGRGSLGRAESAERTGGSFGLNHDEVDLVGNPRNCDVRSSNWLLRWVARS